MHAELKALRFLPTLPVGRMLSTCVRDGCVCVAATAFVFETSQRSDAAQRYLTRRRATATTHPERTAKALTHGSWLHGSSAIDVALLTRVDVDGAETVPLQPSTELKRHT